MKKIAKPIVSVVISNYNGEKYISTCLKSVKETTYKNLEVLVFDDASTDGSVGLIKKLVSNDKRFKIILNSKNRGLTVNKNRSLIIAKGEIVVFLDNDTEVKNNWITPVVATLYKQPDTGACQSLLVEFSERNLIQMAGLKLTKQTGWGMPVAYRKKFGVYNKIEPCIALGAAMAVKKEAALKIGGFDEALIHYTDDLDFSWRLWIAGYKIYTCPKSVVYHYTKPANNIRVPEGKNETLYFHLAKNSFRSLVKNYELTNVMVYLPMSIAINLGRGTLFLFRGKGLSALKGSVRALVWNLANALGLYKQRQKTQGLRKVSDSYLFDRVFSKTSLIEIYNTFYKKNW